MSREISSTNLAQINASTLHEVWLVEMLMSTPVRAHSGFGTITFRGNDYLGVGNHGTITTIRESELVAPASIDLTLSGVDATLLSDALDPSEYGSDVSLWQGFRGTDGLLVDEPIEQWTGWYEKPVISRGEENAITVTCQSDLAVLEEADKTRYSDESQQELYSGDLGFEFVTDMASNNLIWAGGRAGGGGSTLPQPDVYYEQK